MPFKVADIDILIVPGWPDEGPDHWQARWTRNLKTARRIVPEQPGAPTIGERVGCIIAAVEGAARPAVLVAHGLGVAAVVHAAPHLARTRVAGAFLVAPCGRVPGDDSTPLALPGDPLPFPSLVVASRSDPLITFEQAAGLALDWGAAIADAGEAGHIDTASGHGPWPEGLLRFGTFLKRLG